MAGASAGVASVCVLAAAMLPVRPHLSIATAALVLVVPVALGATAGGFGAGLVTVGAGFLAYDLLFIPPYYRLSVGRAQNWVALAVYVLVMLVVTRLVSQLDRARTMAARSSDDARRLFATAELLVQDRPGQELLAGIVSTLRDAFSLDSATLLLPGDDGLQVFASAGDPLEPEDLAGLSQDSPAVVRMRPVSDTAGATRTVALTSGDRPVGVLVLKGGPPEGPDSELVRTFANQAAVAVERSRLREQALRAELLEEVDRLRRSLVGAVSHDLRTPLATIKVSVTTLRDPKLSLPAADVSELLGLIDHQTDRLTRLVTNLLDMTRIQAGVLEIRRLPWEVPELLTESLDPLRPLADKADMEVAPVPPDLPMVLADQVLIGQVLANLVDNAARHAPAGTAVIVSARPRRDGRVEVSVDDAGPGVPPDQRDSVFDSFVAYDTGGRAGLGLAIAKAFVEAHGERIWAEASPAGGARFSFTLAAAADDGAG